jgi:hypothetical protein
MHHFDAQAWTEKLGEIQLNREAFSDKCRDIANKKPAKAGLIVSVVIDV